MRHTHAGIMCAVAVAGLAAIAPATPTANGWDTGHIYVIRGDQADGEIRRLNEYPAPPQDTRHCDAGRLGADLPADGKPKSICFSNSPWAGVNSPAGARLWGVVNYPADSAEPNTTSFRVFEYASTGNELRNFYAGLACGGAGNAELNGPDGRSRAGNIRYNPAKNTIAVACNIALQDASHVIVPGSQQAMVYEFALPDWPAAPGWVTPTLVQRYQLPGKSTADNGNINSPPVIDFDNAGNMYVFGRFYDANADGFRDVIRFSTIGHHAGLNTYTPSITGVDAANLLINGITECNQNPGDCTICYNNPDWQCGGGGWGLAVRTSTNQLVVSPVTVCGPMQTLIYDLTRRVGGGSTGNLVLAHRLPGPCDIPRDGRYAQRDDESQKIYFGHNQGNCCDPGGNFMYLNNDWPADTMTKDVGYFLTIACGGDCDLNKVWDAASPPPPPIPMPGACCMAGNRCEQTMQDACTGTWLGAGIQCGQVPCPAVCADPGADADADGDVDQDDFGILQRCFTGINGSMLTNPLNCSCLNHGADGQDNDIDMLDVIAFTACASGPTISVNPCCDGGPGCP